MFSGGAGGIGRFGGGGDGGGGGGSGSGNREGTAGGGAKGRCECAAGDEAGREEQSDLLRAEASRVRWAGMIVLVSSELARIEMGSARHFLEAKIIGRRLLEVQESRWLRGPEEENNCARGGQRGKTIRRGLYKLRAR